MRTTNTVEMRGDPERLYGRIFQLAADIQDWPTLLPHYRYLHVLEQSPTHKIADFGASRDGFPVRWRARQELFPAEGRITYRHIGGITKGMWVEWRLEKRGDHVRVTIEHELNYPVPIFGPLFAQVIVGNLFVRNIAGKTLRCIQAKVESESSSPL
ncbi:MAG TPA: SRPBCC family protein [Chthonomonadaceae bacterium]|nr:SRPBCC family protein [Chthonomonadaceae bacterium]